MGRAAPFLWASHGLVPIVGSCRGWKYLALPHTLLGKGSASQQRKQCENSQLCSQPQCLLRSPKDLNSEGTDDSVAQETGSEFPGRIHWGSFNRN